MVKLVELPALTVEEGAEVRVNSLALVPVMETLEMFREAEGEDRR